MRGAVALALALAGCSLAPFEPTLADGAASSLDAALGDGGTDVDATTDGGTGAEDCTNGTDDDGDRHADADDPDCTILK